MALIAKVLAPEMNGQTRPALIDTLPSIDELELLPMSRLKQIYTRLNGTPPPFRPGRSFLCGNIAWMLQVIESGADPASVRKKLVKLAERHSGPKKSRYLPGTRLIREWHGVTHEVIIEEKGYRWQRKHYRSLTQIALEITGTKWSGPRFFGLKDSAPK